MTGNIDGNTFNLILRGNNFKKNYKQVTFIGFKRIINKIKGVVYLDKVAVYSRWKE